MQVIRSKGCQDVPSCFPTNPFTISEPQDQEIDEFYEVLERRAMDFKARKL